LKGRHSSRENLSFCVSPIGGTLVLNEHQEDV
jgi:hypothetical protein